MRAKQVLNASSAHESSAAHIILISRVGEPLYKSTCILLKTSPRGFSAGNAYTTSNGLICEQLESMVALSCVFVCHDLWHNPLVAALYRHRGAIFHDGLLHRYLIHARAIMTAKTALGLSSA